MVKKKKETEKSVKIDSFEQKFLEREELIKKQESGQREGNNYLGLLVFLIILILVVDSVSLIVYYKPKMTFIKNGINSITKLRNIGLDRCSDGTTLDTCSTNKPLYCYEGNLVQKAYTCGCPEGYKLSFQDCIKI